MRTFDGQCLGWWGWNATLIRIFSGKLWPDHHGLSRGRLLNVILVLMVQPPKNKKILTILILTNCWRSGSWRICNVDSPKLPREPVIMFRRVKFSSSSHFFGKQHMLSNSHWRQEFLYIFRMLLFSISYSLTITNQKKTKNLPPTLGWVQKLKSSQKLREYTKMITFCTANLVLGCLFFY